MQLSIKENRKKSALSKGSAICLETKKTGVGAGAGLKVKPMGPGISFQRITI